MKRRKRRPPTQVDAILDLECGSWDQYVLGMLMRGDGKATIVRDWRREEEFALKLLNFDGVVWTFNGGKYDTLWVADWCAKIGRRATIRAAGQRIISLETGRLEVRDVSALVPFMSLRDAAKMAGVAKSETGLPCICEGAASCGGYCSISRELSTRQLAELCNYLEDDCRATLAVLDRLFSYGDAHGIEWSMTVGATAYKTARSWLGLDDADFSPREYDYLRKGYYGGRTQVFRPSADAGDRYDINSAYPASLRTIALPYGSRSYCGPTESRAAFRRDAPGVYEVEVVVPASSFMPPLPLRLKNRIAFPTGRFWGAWTRNELAYALEQGVRVVDFHTALVFSDEAPLLAPFCDRVWSYRAQAQKAGDGIQKWLKTLANAMTGKLAQDPHVETIHLIPDGDAPACPGTGACRYECNRKCGGMLPIGRSRYVFSQPSYRLALNAHIVWSAYLTANTRTRQLHAQLIDDGDGGRSAAYCDTDSCYAVAPRLRNIGAELGEFKKEGRFYDWRALAPKTYSYFDDDGEFHAASKGIPDAARNFDALMSGAKVAIDRGVDGIKTAARAEKLFNRKRLSRRILADGRHFGDRILHDDGLTYPQDAAILLAHDSQKRSDAEGDL